MHNLVTVVTEMAFKHMTRDSKVVGSSPLQDGKKARCQDVICICQADNRGGVSQVKRHIPETTYFGVHSNH